MVIPPTSWELLRGVAAFLAAPLLLHLAMTGAPKPSAGFGIAIWVCLGVAAGGGLFAVYLIVLGRARLQRPDFDRWQEGEEPAWESPALAAGIRGEGADGFRGRPPGATKPASTAG